jgi:hypothetical protein
VGYGWKYYFLRATCFRPENKILTWVLLGKSLGSSESCSNQTACCNPNYYVGFGAFDTFFMQTQAVDQPLIEYLNLIRGVLPLLLAVYLFPPWEHRKKYPVKFFESPMLRQIRLEIED